MSDLLTFYDFRVLIPIGIAASVAYLGIYIWKYLIVWPIKTFLSLRFVILFFKAIVNPFKIKQYPPPYKPNKKRNSNKKTKANGTNEVQGKIVKRSQVDQYIFNQSTLNATANSIFSPEFQYCEELTRDALFEKYPDHAKKRELCSICIENLHSKDLLLLLPCDHVYHRDCLHDFKRTLQTTNSNQVVMVRCPTCQLNLVRLYQYYIDHGLDFKEVKFDNKG
ncbi:putative membrane protein [Wickerhamomyces ciferrii]|uniref:Membrane protein n=1 Tax=Wickerhamomyces ciferrii (strain ATCC 14091 / BCRC 22168 / CBS 111 / JCM 3599 / NBRC 0793 / NRRL Y-1031 F-60-10) TaxID=1206466 RepID=K0KL54_WICCF|nr:uncharacterized protein BN7_5557 [Wickerhamomyces ciferrii]CCH45970.1 putative membrane protein [Wickerhamomyces ciferrii]